MFLQPLRLMFLQPCKAHVKPAMAHVDSAFELTPSQLARITFMQPLVFMFNQLESSCPAFTAHAFHTGMHTRLPWQARGTLTCRCQLIVMALTIQTLFGISYKGKHCKVPEDLLVKEEETQEMFLKIRPTHVGLIHVICAGQDISKGMSLSESSGLKKLKGLRDAAIDEVLSSTTEQKGADAQEPDDLFQAEAEGSEVGPRKKKVKIAPSLLPNTIVISLDNFKVKVLVPKARHSQADLAVLFHQDHLLPVFELIAADCEECSQACKRSYRRTGKFAKTR